MKRQGVFITGTDTDVGKTHIGSRIAKDLFLSGVKIHPRKPAESGCSVVDGERIGSDSRAYFDACDQTISLETITPFRFLEALAPPAAAQAEGKTLSLNQLKDASLKDAEKGFLLVEGAGGFMSPIADDGLNADLATEVRLPVLIVAADKLGCLNHILLTKEAVEARGLQVQAIVLNRIDTDQSVNSNYDWLVQSINTPVFVYDESAPQNTTISDVNQILLT